MPIHPGCSNILYLLYTKLDLFDSSEDQTQKPLDAQTKKNLLATLSALDVEDNILSNKHGSDISALKKCILGYGQKMIIFWFYSEFGF